MSNATKTKLKVSLKLAHEKVPDVISLAQTVLAYMTAAVLIFTTPPIPMALLRQNLENLIASYSAAIDGSRKLIAQRNNDRHVLEQNLILLGAYAVNVADGDLAILALSGFTPAPPRSIQAPVPLSPPSVRSIRQGKSGQLLILLVRFAMASSFEVRYAGMVNGIPGSWLSVAVATATRTPLTIDALTPGTIYAFQVRALGRLGFSDWSDSYTRMCI